MKILYIHQYFNTPREPGGTRSYWIAQEMIKRGHEVTMITSRYPQKEFKRVEEVDGISVIYLRVNYSNKMGIFKRLVSFTRFMLASTKEAFAQKNTDVVFATSTPLTIGIPAYLLKKFKRIPYIFEVRDLWPEVPIQMGAIKNKLIIGLTRQLERTIYNNAKHIVALSPGMEEGVIQAGIKKEKVSMVPNMAKIDQFYSRPINQEILSRFNLDQEKFRIIYFGALGQANAIDYIVDVADLLKSNSDIEFVFIGRGAMQNYLESEIQNRGLVNVKYLGAFKMDITSELVNASQVSLVTFSDIPILKTNSPNKLFDSLSAGKPIIVNSAGWTKAMVEQYDCGFFVDPKDPKDCATKITDIYREEAKLGMMGENSRNLATSQYDKGILCRELVDIVEANFF
ncbi:glycosyltransferase family 4 protein [Aureicoccus marinus]|jgi:glycosyltransferase involved in cell wall biosynthesis|uniref:Glycosyltransferase WbuB n=1 Tax=Aureicoccus marinus TaxID=754435 RepID=A0A2S7T6P0_9FLAO|nr:glycosyltransferase family 4 protein [Aureicoccus marinus]PQJ15251.1 hypothetical protein BST99_05475 [Aureicoccus marinus]